MANVNYARMSRVERDDVNSARSVRSIKSGPVKTFRQEKKVEEIVGSFDKMLIMACTRFLCHYTVAVKKDVKTDYYKNLLLQARTKIKSKRISVMTLAREPFESDTKSSTLTISTENDSSSESLPAINITIFYDNNVLKEILLTKLKGIPRTLLRIISLLLPYYPNLTRITISKCVINMYTIYELSKILDASTITEICLDGSSVPGIDFKMLLETTKLRHLSLCRCNVQDEICKLFAVNMRYQGTAQMLSLLNLSSNHITDEGAKHISDALRTNRHLRYLNLADNHITDCGAARILDVLIEFPLTYDETMNMRQRRMEYLRRKNDLYAKFLSQICNRSFDEFSQFSRKSTSHRKRKPSSTAVSNKKSGKKDQDQINDDYIKTKAEMLTVEVLGPFDDPFNSKTVKRIDGYDYCVGNMTLAYLNFAYNHLSYISVRKLECVMKYQNSYRTSEGLVKVVLEGNNLPVSCPELTHIDELMGSKVLMNLSKSNRVEK